MKRAILFVAVWILGCVIFDLLLNFQGPWLMLGGVITYWVAELLALRGTLAAKEEE